MHTLWPSQASSTQAAAPPCDVAPLTLLHADWMSHLASPHTRARVTLARQNHWWIASRVHTRKVARGPSRHLVKHYHMHSSREPYPRRTAVRDEHGKHASSARTSMANMQAVPGRAWQTRRQCRDGASSAAKPQTHRHRNGPMTRSNVACSPGAGSSRTLALAVLADDVATLSPFRESDLNSSHSPLIQVPCARGEAQNLPLHAQHLNPSMTAPSARRIPLTGWCCRPAS